MFAGHPTRIGCGRSGRSTPNSPSALPAAGDAMVGQCGAEMITWDCTKLAPCARCVYFDASTAAAAGHISERYEMGALHSVLPTFYVHLGWEKWRGPTYVRSETGLTRTPEDDGYIHVWHLPASSDLNLDDPISCPWRPGYVW